MDNEWDKVTVIRKKAPGTSRAAHSNAAINEARRSGTVVAVEKKSTFILN